jgi:hypothetical protein
MPIGTRQRVPVLPITPESRIDEERTDEVLGTARPMYYSRLGVCPTVTVT